MSTAYKGAVVLGVSDEEVQEVLIPIRLTLERYSFTHAIARMTDDDLGELGKQVWHIEQAAAANDLPRLVEADLRFHEVVISSSRSAHTVQIWGTIWPRIRAYFYRYGRGKDLATMVVEHRELLAALQSRDVPLTLKQLEGHIAVPARLDVQRAQGTRDVVHHELGPKVPRRAAKGDDDRSPQRRESSHRLPLTAA